MGLNKIVLSALMALNIAAAPVSAEEIRSVPYRHFEMVQSTNKVESEGLQSIVKNDSLKLRGVKGVVDKDEFYSKFMQVSDNLGYKNIEDMDMKGFISWNSAVTKFIIQGYSGHSQADNIPFEDLIRPEHYKGEDSFTGVCRHYSTFLKEAFDATKHLNKNMDNVECLIVGNRKDNHAWNMYLTEGNSKIISTETDVYQRDLAEEADDSGVNAVGDFQSSPGMFERDNTRYGAGMRWQTSDFWNKHDKEHTGNRYNPEKLNK